MVTVTSIYSNQLRWEALKWCPVSKSYSQPLFGAKGVKFKGLTIKLLQHYQALSKPGPQFSDMSLSLWWSSYPTSPRKSPYLASLWVLRQEWQIGLSLHQQWLIKSDYLPHGVEKGLKLYLNSTEKTPLSNTHVPMVIEHRLAITLAWHLSQAYC